MASADAVTGTRPAMPRAMAKAIAIPVGVVIFASAIVGFLIRGQYQRLTKVEDTQGKIIALVQDVKTLLDGQAALLVLVQKQQTEEANAGVIRKAQLDRLTELATGLQAIAQRTEVIARQVPDCFKPPSGDCVKASAASLERIRKDQETLLARTTFVVTNPAKPGDTPLMVTPLIHPSPVCQPAVGVGNVGVLPGLLCTKP